MPTSVMMHRMQRVAKLDATQMRGGSMRYQCRVPRVVVQLGPLRSDLPAELKELALALRKHFYRLQTSLRTYAAMQGMDPSLVSRYLSGHVLPPETFPDDLIDEVERRCNQKLAGEAQRLRGLLHNAQDAQSGTWGRTKRLQREIVDALEQARELRRETKRLLEENQTLRERVRELEHQLVKGQVPTPQADDQPCLLRNGAYWTAYRRALQVRGWSAKAIVSEDVSTNHVLDVLADPAAKQPHAVRGSVVHHVGSGTTASMIALVAKAVDIGYRLVIVLSGTHNVVRRQLQQRLDEDLSSLKDTIRIIRLTDQEMDYRQLATGLSALEFEKQWPALPLNDPTNLSGAAVRLVVVKKNRAVLRKLRYDLLAIRTPLDEIPALVVDSEAGTAQPGSALNSYVAALLDALPRAQYVGYTSDPSVGVPRRNGDVAVPKDFVATLPRPETYIGARDFFDTDTTVPVAQREYANSGEKSHVRRVEPGDRGLLTAMDMFVLTAAVKVHREAVRANTFPHHRMLVYTTARIDGQAAIRSRLTSLWHHSDYVGPSARERLRTLFDNDVRAVTRARFDSFELPRSFGELEQSLDTALARIGDQPISEKLEYDRNPLWTILVTGPKPAGTNVDDGLTILYVDDQSSPAGLRSLLKVWFGVRPGYTDMVRLYIPYRGGQTDAYAVLASYVREHEAPRRYMRAEHGILEALPPSC